MKIEFERATLNDVDNLIEVQNKSFYSDYLEYGECPGYNRSYESMACSITDRYTYKILCDKEIVGDIIVRDNGNGDYFLGCICIIPEHQNKGIGQLGMRFLEKEFPKAIHWSLETPLQKKRNHYFYKKHGFKITKEYMDGAVQIVLFEKFCNPVE